MTTIRKRIARRKTSRQFEVGGFLGLVVDDVVVTAVEDDGGRVWGHVAHPGSQAEQEQGGMRILEVVAPGPRTVLVQSGSIGLWVEGRLVDGSGHATLIGVQAAQHHSGEVEVVVQEETGPRHRAGDTQFRHGLGEQYERCPEGRHHQGSPEDQPGKQGPPGLARVRPGHCHTHSRLLAQSLLSYFFPRAARVPGRTSPGGSYDR